MEKNGGGQDPSDSEDRGALSSWRGRCAGMNCSHAGDAELQLLGRSQVTEAYGLAIRESPGEILV